MAGQQRRNHELDQRTPEQLHLRLGPLPKGERGQ